jgi:hypothetical protein
MYGKIYQSKVSGLFYSLVGWMFYATLRQVWHNDDDNKWYVVLDGAITITHADLRNDFVDTGLCVGTYH